MEIFFFLFFVVAVLVIGLVASFLWIVVRFLIDAVRSATSQTSCEVSTPAGTPAPKLAAKSSARSRSVRLRRIPYDYRVGPPTGTGAFLDVETTGLSRYTDEIVEFSMALFTFDRRTGRVVEIVDEYTGLNQPSIPIPPDAIRIHGITDADVAGKRLDQPRIEMMVKDAEFIIAHNATFDSAFVTRVVPTVASKPWFCSMNGIDWRGEGFRSKSLDSLVSELGISLGGGHRAASHVREGVLLLGRLSSRRIPYLLELLRHGHINAPTTTSRAVSQ